MSFYYHYADGFTLRFDATKNRHFDARTVSAAERRQKEAERQRAAIVSQSAVLQEAPQQRSREKSARGQTWGGNIC
jgi:hypothetical protein